MSRSDIDFMSELDAAINLKPARPALLMVYAIAALSVVSFLWAAFSEIEQLTRADGQVVPTKEVQVVQSLEGGILAELLTAEGAYVKKGETLMRISDVQFSAEERGTEARSLGLRIKRVRLKAEAEGKIFEVPADILEKAPIVAANEKALYDSRQKELANSFAILEDRINKANAEIAEIDSDIARLSENRKGLNKELEITRKMVAQRAMPELEKIRLERELSDISGQMNSQSRARDGLKAELQVALREKESQTNTFRSEALQELSDVETQIAAMDENLKSIGDRVDRTEIKSPVDGIVNTIAITTEGGVIEPAMRLMEIVPTDDALKIVARVKPDEIAFLHPGQDVKVKVTAYDSQKYGRLDGKLVRIGANSVTDKDGNPFFEIEVKTDRNYLGTAEMPLPITPGMVAQAEIITGKRSILDYLLKPVLRARDMALTER